MRRSEQGTELVEGQSDCIKDIMKRSRGYGTMGWDDDLRVGFTAYEHDVAAALSVNTKSGAP